MKNISSSKGFTLIELMTSISLFAVFIIIMAGVFSRFVETERHNIAQGALIVDVQSAMESFIKEARTGYGSTYRTDNGQQVAFRNQAGACVVYRVSSIGMFERAEKASNTSGECNSGLFSADEYVPITSKDTIISEAFFDTTIATGPAGGSLANQGVVTLVLTAKSSRAEIVSVRVQNSITSRQVAAYE